jgi:hypothetical protein
MSELAAGNPIVDLGNYNTIDSSKESLEREYDGMSTETIKPIAPKLIEGGNG